MKKFQFTLQALHTLRERQEQVALEQYARTILARAHAVDALRVVDRECEQAWQFQRELRAGGLAVVQLAQAREYVAGLETLKKQCAAAIAEAQRAVDLAWEKLARARRAREAVTRFHQRQFERHQRAGAQEAQKELDDFAQRRLPLAVALGPVEEGF